MKMRSVKIAHADRLRQVVEFEFERFVQERSTVRCQQAIDSFAIEMTRAGTKLFLNALTEPEVISMLGGRAG